jgi:hypothetical protein
MNLNSISQIVNTQNLDISTLYLDDNGTLSQAEEALPLVKTKLLCDGLKKVLSQDGAHDALSEKLRHLYELATQRIETEFYKPLQEWEANELTSLYTIFESKNRYESHLKNTHYTPNPSLAAKRIKEAFDSQNAELDLSFLNLESLPDALTELTHLTSLNLNQNVLHPLPAEIGKLKLLKILFLGSNQLSIFPEVILGMHQLRRLFLYSNQIDSLPPKISQLEKLEELWMMNNQLHSLPSEISKLQKLKHLCLFNNKLAFLPITVFNLKNLISISTFQNPCSLETPYLCLLYNPDLWTSFNFTSSESISLKEQFDHDPEATKLSYPLQFMLHVDLLALSVLFSDGFITFKPALANQPQNESEKKAQRFFNIIEKLPLELQTIIANRAYGSSKNFIPANEFEERFQIVYSPIPKSS